MAVPLDFYMRYNLILAKLVFDIPLVLFLKPFIILGSLYLKRKIDMDNILPTKWKDVTVKEKWQIINGTVLVFAAIALYFISFLLTMTIGLDVVSAGASMLATALAFFGITSYIKSQMIEFRTEVQKKMKQLEDIEQARKLE